MRALRHRTASSRRRSIVAFAVFAAVDFALGSLVQTGVIRRLPDPPIFGVDSHRVMTSPAAYPAGIPDTALALMHNGLVIALAGAASRTTNKSRRLTLDLMLAGAVVLGSLGVAHYLAEMIRLRRACVYCIAAAAAMLATVPLAFRNARDSDGDVHVGSDYPFPA